MGAGARLKGSMSDNIEEQSKAPTPSSNPDQAGPRLVIPTEPNETWWAKRWRSLKTRRVSRVHLYADGIRADYGKLIVVTLVTLFLALAAIPPILNQFDRIEALAFQRLEAREEYQAALSERDETLRDLTEVLSSPIPREPASGSKENSSTVELHWDMPPYAKSPSIKDYSVEIIHYDGAQPPTLVRQKVTNPDANAHQLDTQSGFYLWRVAAERGDPSLERSERDVDTLKRAWSGYSVFWVDPSPPVANIKVNLRVGINFSQHSPFMTRTGSNLYCGFDAELIRWIGKRLHREIDWREFASVPALLAAVREGQVDIAIGSITHTRQREQNGNAFSHGYLSSPPVLACRLTDSLCTSSPKRVFAAMAGDEVGVIGATTNEDAAKDLQASFKFIVKQTLSFRSLISMLDLGRVHFIIVDRPFIQHRCTDASPMGLRCFNLPRVFLKDYDKTLGTREVEQYAMAIDDASLRAVVNDSLLSAHREGELDRLSETYLVRGDACVANAEIH